MEQRPRFLGQRSILGYWGAEGRHKNARAWDQYLDCQSLNFSASAKEMNYMKNNEYTIYQFSFDSPLILTRPAQQETTSKDSYLKTKEVADFFLLVKLYCFY